MPHERAAPAPAALLPTKFFIPVLDPNVVERERVLELLDPVQHARLVLVSAPAGSGKTTLVTNWVRRVGTPVAWVSLDPGDDDPQVFLACLAEAFHNIGPDVCARTRALLGSGTPTEPHLLASSLLGDLVQSGRPCTLVLDDLHLLASPVVHDVLTLIVERAPPGVTFVAISRSDPPIPLARMRARGQLLEVREADLRFDAEEAGHLVGRLSRRPLHPASMVALAERTEGWAVGLQLAGLALRKAPDPEAFVEEFRGTHTYVADYLAGEVLASLPVEHQEFLMRTAPLRRLTGPLCDATLEREGSQHVLEEMNRANLFLVPLDADGRWYRYHHLFADLLLRRFAQKGEDERPGILSRAATWCEANGDVAGAIDYALEAGDARRAADLVARHGIGALAAGQGFSVLRWIRSLPDEVVEVSPDHCVIAAWALTLMHLHEPTGGVEDLDVQRRGTALLSHASPDPIGGFARRAIEMLAEGRRPFPHVQDVAQHAQVLLATADDADGPLAALEALEKARDETPEENRALRAVAEIRIGELCSLLGLYERGRLAQDRARETAILAGSELLRLSAITGSALILLQQGRLGAVIAWVERELASRTSLKESLGAYVGNLHATLAAAHLERDELEAAETGLARAWSAWGSGDDPSDAWRTVSSFGRPRPRASHLTVHGVLWGFHTHIRLLLRRGQPAVALRQLDEVEAAMRSSVSSTYRAVLALLRIRAQAAAGERSLLRQGWRAETIPASGSAHWDQAARLARARMALSAGDRTSAEVELGTIIRESEGSDRDLALAEALVMHGVAGSGGANTRHARRRIQAALEETAPERRIAPWLEAGAAVIPLLEEVVREGEASPESLNHAAELLRRLSPDARTGSRDGTPPLSDREVAVLRLLAAGHSNVEIARALFLAVGTVKKHTHNIFGKLHVTNRTQAAQRAGEMGLLG